MKKILFLLMALVLPMVASADDETQRLVVWFTNGTKVTHELTDEPETRFNNGMLMLSTKKVSISYPIAQVLRYTYEGKTPLVNVPTVKPGEIRFSQGTDEMRFDGLAAGTVLELYSPDGKLLRTQTAASGQPAVVSVKGQPAGLYIVKVGDASYKFLKK